MAEHSSHGPDGPKIELIEAFVVVGDKDYVGDAGLNLATASTDSPVKERRGRTRTLTDITDLHICSYPSQAQTCLIRITASDGTFGWGEAHAPVGPRATQAVIEDVLAPLLLGEDPFRIEYLWERVFGSMRLRGHNAGYQLEAIAGVDIALWDLVGKLLGEPVYRLLGGPFRTELPTYASGTPGATVEERIVSVSRFVEEGYTAIKASIGRGNLDEEIAGIAMLAKATHGKADLLVDAHGAYTTDNALYVGRRLQDLGVYWLEDPLPPDDIAGYHHLTAALDMAVAAGETECTRWQFSERLSQRSVDVILPDVCRAGGISEGRKIATVASLHNMKWAAHTSMGTSVHVAAAAHLAAATANFLIFEFPSSSNPLGDILLTEPLHPERGYLRVPNGPGLGITFDENKLADHIRLSSRVTLEEVAR